MFKTLEFKKLNIVYYLGFRVSNFHYYEFARAKHKLCLFVSRQFQVLFHSLLWGLFTFPSRD